jgi:hypothetical protein
MNIGLSHCSLNSSDKEIIKGMCDDCCNNSDNNHLDPSTMISSSDREIIRQLTRNNIPNNNNCHIPNNNNCHIGSTDKEIIKSLCDQCFSCGDDSPIIDNSYITSSDRAVIEHITNNNQTHYKQSQNRNYNVTNNKLQQNTKNNKLQQNNKNNKLQQNTESYQLKQNNKNNKLQQNNTNKNYSYLNNNFFNDQNGSYNNKNTNYGFGNIRSGYRSSGSSYDNQLNYQNNNTNQINNTNDAYDDQINYQYNNKSDNKSKTDQKNLKALHIQDYSDIIYNGTKDSIYNNPEICTFTSVITPVTNLVPLYSGCVGSVEFIMRRRNKTIMLQWEPFTCVLTTNGITCLTVCQSISNLPPYKITCPIYIEYKGQLKLTFVTVDPESSKSIKFYLNSDSSTTDVNANDNVVILAGCINWLLR